ncbi:hypothetical protein I5Q34_16020 [Streptomyces sp. AV19]|uniref:hypothetical protein n=1 Tax=Streptomyces sp. AV19 TaxID=2793068 RepID=UPI0018FE9500|nr:hypothetical protein [Streptomyces sp. AV19]MBH1935759.1 hypothetical protein [Streptomyces sp. AV19]MDG4535966.1 hypothetical protein [Streptomyces sp. AV19]
MLSPRAQEAMRIARALRWYAPALALLALVSPREDGVGFLLGVGGALGLAGGVPLVWVARRVRALWLLRERGIGVVGRVTGHVHIWDKGGHLWEFSTMSFTTLDGRRVRDVPSVVTIWCLSRGRSPGAEVALSYDPECPTRASRPLTVGFVLRTLLLAAVASVPAYGFLVCVGMSLPF